MPSCRLLVLLALLLGAGACGGGAPATTAAGDPLGPLEALADCEETPTATADVPEGLVLPEGVIVQQVTPQDPLTNVVAYVAMTPTQFQAAYEDLDVEILTSENEVYEAELLVSNSTHRSYLKAAAICREGSAILAVVAPEGQAGLPVPRGVAGSPGSSPPPTTLPTGPPTP